MIRQLKAGNSADNVRNGSKAVVRQMTQKDPAEAGAQTNTTKPLASRVFSGVGLNGGNGDAGHTRVAYNDGSTPDQRVTPGAMAMEVDARAIMGAVRQRD